MSNINVAVAHQLTQQEATRRVQGALREVTTRFADKISNLKEAWDGDVGTFSLVAMGMPVTGTLAVNPAQVEISGTLPFAALFFKDQIETVIREHAEAVLA